MPSRLSSLLVRDGLVGVKRMEKAFQRQVIYGGSLDTILLEMGLVPEERLTQYLALASGLPPAAREEGTVIDVAATAVIAREIAEQYRAVPVAFEGDALRLLVCAPLEITELEDLADLIDIPLQPLITPEYRWHLAYSSAYSLDPPARFTTLARSLDVDPMSAPVGRPRTIIIEDSGSSRGIPSAPLSDDRTEPTTVPLESPFARRGSPIDPVAPDAHTMKISAYEAPRGDPRDPASVPEALAHDPSSRAKHGTLMGVRPNRAHTEAGIIQPSRKPAGGPVTLPAIEPDADVVIVDVPLADPPVASVDVPKSAGGGWGVPAVAPTPVVKPPSKPSKPLQRPQTSPISTVGRDSPIPLGKARELLATAEDRDTVFLTLLRATRARAKWAGLLTVQGGAAIGRVALAEPGIDTLAVNSILIPLDAVSPFRTVISAHQPHIGPLVSGDPGIDSMILRMGGTMPPSALIMPIVLRDRVIAVLVAHRSSSELRIVDVTELLPMANVASDAIGRLIVKHKAAGYRAPEAGAVTNEFEAEIDTKRIVQRAPETWAVPDVQERPAEVAIEPQDSDFSITTEAPRGIEALINEIEAGREGASDDALADAVERANETLGALMRRFPGKLRVDRFAVTGRPLRAAQYGGLLELVVRLGSAASELLIEKMSDAQRDVRFYATICAAELRPRNAVFGLAERLFDQDFGVRATAIEALSGYPLQDLGHALVRVRRAIHSTDPEVVAAATAAIVELGDVDALSELMGAVERSDRAGDHARRALVTLTAQDFGPSERKWRKWWDGAKQRHRIEWLIDGLVHREDAIREVAINDLRRLTGEYFGYHHDLPKKEREAAAGRWATWWRETGQRRFETREVADERRRPTAVLPRRD